MEVGLGRPRFSPNLGHASHDREPAAVSGGSDAHCSLDGLKGGGCVARCFFGGPGPLGGGVRRRQEAATTWYPASRTLTVVPGSGPREFRARWGSGGFGPRLPKRLGRRRSGPAGGGVATLLGGGGERSDHSGELLPVQQHGSLVRDLLVEMLKALVFVAKQPVEGGPQEAWSQAVEGEPKLGQWIGARSRKVYR